MTEFDTRMASLKARFAERMAEEREILQAALATCNRPALRDQAHKLAGIAPMLGFLALGDAALALEATVDAGEEHAAAAHRVIALLDAAPLPD
ncbi:Hpt domain-containing protein [Aurantiacibacter spongiae]|uniref:HPt domain-containing protein n=1 Tax=Aurantiacibacter spongiae TaxID=2488860 RepID=A0A3N5CWH2_9SPHN|nr:Hpt domain-containing protein [Aurantiacibacter spongiae]RPF70989.1 hypothetical protein EG799_04665 [Aurantiacibacter spongiae]